MLKQIKLPNEASGHTLFSLTDRRADQNLLTIADQPSKTFVMLQVPIKCVAILLIVSQCCGKQDTGGAGAGCTRNTTLDFAGYITDTFSCDSITITKNYVG